MKYTITELLNKLKILKARIEKETTTSIFVTSVKGNKAPKDFTSKEAFETKAKAQLQSIQSLIENRNKIKAAIVKSNAETMVKVGVKEYTVAEAIERKNSIEFERALLKRLATQFQVNSTAVETANHNEESRLDTQLLAILGKEKSDTSAVETITNTFWKENKSVVVDPCNSLELSEKMGNEIAEFLSNVDVALSISNARIEIEADF